MCKPPVEELRESFNKEKLKRLRTVEPNSRSAQFNINDLRSNASKNGKGSNFADALEDIKKTVNQSVNKIIAFTLHSPINNKKKWNQSSSQMNSHLGIVQKHERTASFLNKLPFELKEILESQSNLDCSLAPQYLSLDPGNSNNSKKEENTKTKDSSIHSENSSEVKQRDREDNFITKSLEEVKESEKEDEPLLICNARHLLFRIAKMTKSKWFNRKEHSDSK